MAAFKKRYKRLTCDFAMSPPTKLAVTSANDLINVPTKITKSPWTSVRQKNNRRNNLLSGLLFFNILTLLIINVTGGQVSHSFASFNSPSLLPVSSSYSSLTSSTFSIAASPPSSSSSNNNHNPFLNSPHARDGKCTVTWRLLFSYYCSIIHNVPTVTFHLARQLGILGVPHQLSKQLARSSQF